MGALVFHSESFQSKNSISSCSRAPSTLRWVRGLQRILEVPGTDPCAALGLAGGKPGVNRSLKANNNHEISPRVGSPGSQG